VLIKRFSYDVLIEGVTIKRVDCTLSIFDHDIACLTLPRKKCPDRVFFLLYAKFNVTIIEEVCSLGGSFLICV